MVALLLAGARTQPVVLAFEDLHWADPTSLDLIQALAERGAQAPLLVVATTRPEFRAPWGMRSHHAVVALAPLDRTEVRRMVGEIAAQHALPQEVVERVSERTGGVPLFVEEVTRLLVERGEQGGVQAIPPTLQQSLAARLDRLGAAREVAQIGAVLGRDFVYALLRDVAEMDEPALQASLDRLADADLLFVEGAPPEANYRFKHALIQDAAYDSLLKSRRQALHRRAAEALREAQRRARSHCAPFHTGRPRRTRDRMVGQGRRSGAAPLGVPGGDRPSRQGDRHGGQGGGRDGVAAIPERAGNCRSPTATRSSWRAALARRKQRKRSPEPAISQRSAKTDAPSDLRPTSAYLWAASFTRASCSAMRMRGARSCATSKRRADLAGGRRRHRACRNHRLVRGEYLRGA